VSQRKPKPPDLPPGGTRSFTVKVCCSDRGQHARIVLHHLQDVRSWELDESVMWIEDGRNGAPAARSEDGVLHFSIRCPRCLRNPQLREESLLRILDALAARDTGEGHATLDISLLPC
jgi:hypothetical protein